MLGEEGNVMQEPQLWSSRTVVVDPAFGTHPLADLVVTTLAQAADSINANNVPTQVLFAPGKHEVRQGGFFRGAQDLCILAPWGVAVLVGGTVIDKPEWQACDDLITARLPANSRTHVRALQLSPSSLEGWSGGLAGPVHHGEWPPVVPGRSELFISGKAMVPARWPSVGYAPIESIIDAGSVPRETADDMPLSKRGREAPRGGVFTMPDHDRLARWADASDLWAAGLWNWDWSFEQLPITKIDPKAGSITLGLPHMYGLAKSGQFFVTNVLEELDSPGEYWIDKERGVVNAWVPEGQEQSEAVVSLLQDPILSMEGCRDVLVRGLRFAYTQGVAISANGLRVEDCSFSNVGTHGVHAEGRAVAIARCSFDDIGAIGVELTGGDRRTLTPSESSIEDCTLRRCGRVIRSYQPAVQLRGVGHRVARNEIADHPHTALQLAGNDHMIEGNYIHDLVLETGDSGAVLCPRDWTFHGNVIRGNVFGSIPGTDARFQNAVYLDDMTSGVAVEGNLFVRCHLGVLVGGGRDVAVRRNAFAACGTAVLYDARGVGWMAPEIADPATSTLLRRYAQVPVPSGPWAARFPTLAAYLTDRFGRPVGGAVERTALVGGTAFGTVEDLECVAVSGTVVVEVPPDEVEARCDAWLQAVRGGAVEIGGVCVGPVGPAPLPTS